MNVTNIKKLGFSTLLAIEWSIYVVISLAANFSYFLFWQEDSRSIGLRLCYVCIVSMPIIFYISHWFASGNHMRQISNYE